MAAKKTFHNLPGEKQNKIIAVAIQEFAAKGYQKASINNMIASLGIAKGSMYQYFENKESLFLYIFEYGVHKIKENIRQAEESIQPDHDVFAKITAYFSSTIEFVKNYPLIFHLYLRTVFETDVPFKQEIVRKIRLSSIEYLISLLEQGKQGGEIRKDCNLQLTAFIFDATIDRLLQSCIGSYFDSTSTSQQAFGKVKENLEEVIEILRKGLAA